MSKNKAVVKTVKECYGARIEAKPEFAPDKPSPRDSSLSAIQLRSKYLKSRHKKEVPRPARLYDCGNAVYVNVKGVEWHNGKIVGYEWGGDNKFKNRLEWLYYVKQLDAHQGFWLLLGESEISGLISL